MTLQSASYLYLFLTKILLSFLSLSAGLLSGSIHHLALVTGYEGGGERSKGLTNILILLLDFCSNSLTSHSFSSWF